MMKIEIVAMCLLLALPVYAKDKKDGFNLTGRLLSAQQVNLTASFGMDHVSLVAIGDKVYTVHRPCKTAKVGNDYPARLVGKRLELLIDQNKVCKYNISGVAER
jgi:hypothetical protein